MLAGIIQWPHTLRQAATFPHQGILQVEEIPLTLSEYSTEDRLTPCFRDPILRNSVEIVSPKKSINHDNQHREFPNDLAGRLLALDPGDKRVGVAISDELHLTVRPLKALQRTNWKKLLADIKELLTEFDAKALVIGLPLSLDGTERSSAIGARQLAHKFALSLDVPIFLQDERLTSREAEESMRAAGHRTDRLRKELDSESAAIFLRDFIGNRNNRIEVKP